MDTIDINNKWIDADFVELDNSGMNPVTGENKLFLRARIFPFNKISRNGIMYNRQYAEKTKDQIIGLNLHHNHITDGEKVYPKGEWIESWIQDDGLYAKSQIYNTQYNRDYIEWVSNAKNIKVSLQVNGESKSRKSDTGERYQEAFIKNWKEISTVNIPGFIDASAQFGAMAEKLNKVDEVTDKILNLIESKL